jgi:hypothetical protein
MTLDDVFRKTAARRPDAVALADSPDRMQTEGVAPRRLTYAQADRAVSVIAGRLLGTGLSADAIVAVQLPNTVDAVLTFLGILRAGMIAAPLPLLWRHAECTAALSSLGPKALITCSRHRGFDHAQTAMQIAVDIFPVRYIFGFGAAVADGIIPLNDVYDDDDAQLLAQDSQCRNDPAAHVAAVTFDVTADGPIAVARNHLELLSAGVGVLLESHIPQHAVILSAIAPASLAGLSAAVLPWLLSGGTLVLHDPFSPDIYSKQIAEYPCDTLVLPGPIVPRLSEAGLLSAPDIKRLLAVWRSPERLIGAVSWRNPAVAVSDLMVFGETAVIARQRGTDGKPVPLPLGPVRAPCSGPDAAQIAEIARTDTGALAVRGPMVPRYSFPPDAERGGIAAMRIASDGMVNTGYTCRHIRETNSLIVTGPPAGLASVGGYRFLLRELQALVSGVDNTATLAALPDALAGHRLAGHSSDRAATRDALETLGANPLLVRAFRERSQSGMR